MPLKITYYSITINLNDEINLLLYDELKDIIYLNILNYNNINLLESSESIDIQNILYYPLFTIENITDDHIIVTDFEIIKFLKLKSDSNFKQIKKNFEKFITQIYINEEDKISTINLKKIEEEYNDKKYTEIIDNNLLKKLLDDQQTFKQVLLKILKNNNFKKTFDFKNNNFLEYIIIKNNLYLKINNENIIDEIKLAPIKTTFYIEYDGVWGSRLGNNLFGLFRSSINIYNFINEYKNTIEYIFNITINYNLTTILYNYIIIYDGEYPINNISKINNYHLKNIPKIQYPINDLFDTLLDNNIKILFNKLISKMFSNVLLQQEIISENLKNNNITINKNTKIISLHYRLSDFCAGNSDDTIFKNLWNDSHLYCYNSDLSIPTSINEGIYFKILSFSYYIKCIEKIINNNKDNNYNYLIIIYYLKTNNDNIIIKLLIEYIKYKFSVTNIQLITEHQYYKDIKLNELDLIYHASLNDYIILSNSTFGFWMCFLKILKELESEKTTIDSIYYGKYLIYTENDKIDHNAFLKFDKNALLKINSDCKIETEDIYYFYCLKNDIVRLLLIMLYFKYKYNVNIEDINKKTIIYNPDDLLFIKLHCFNLIKIFYEKYNKIKEDGVSVDFTQNTRSIDDNYINEIVNIINTTNYKKSEISEIDKIINYLSYNKSIDTILEFDTLSYTRRSDIRKYMKYKFKYLEYKKNLEHIH